MDLVSRLKQYLDARQISVTQFADECSIPRPTASQLLAGRNKKVSDEIIGKIHNKYPDLSIVWLMFGEGDMVTNGNIKTSEPQIGNVFDNSLGNITDHQVDTINSDTNKFDDSKSPEKIETANPSGFTFPEENETTQNLFQQHESPYSNSFSFTNDTNEVETTPSNPTAVSTESDRIKSPTSTSAATVTANESRPITVTPGKGKRVTGIVVYYDDSTYESFIPDPTHRHPFMP